MIWESKTTTTYKVQNSQADNPKKQEYTKHYIYEPNSFVPALQAGYSQFIKLIETPDYSRFKTEPYSIYKDPVWKTETRKQRTELERVAFYHCDQVGTPQSLSNELEECVWSIRQSTWGRAEEISQPNPDNPFEQTEIRFQGQYYDEETGLHYNRYRYYEPHSARYISKDPIGLQGGLNNSAYVSDPNQWVDPLGLAGIWTNGKGAYSDRKEGSDWYPASDSYGRPDSQALAQENKLNQLRQQQIEMDHWRKEQVAQRKAIEENNAKYNEWAREQNRKAEQQLRIYNASQIPKIETPWVPPALPQEVVDFSAGVGDMLSFGATDYIRDKMGTNGVVDKGSYSYGSGQATGVAVGMMTEFGAAASARGVGTVAQIGTTNVLKASAISSVTGQVYTCNCDYASVNINTPIGSVGTTVNLLSPDVFGSVGGSASNVAEPAGKAIAKAIGLPTKHIEKPKPASLSVTFGKVENISENENRAREVSEFLKGKSYNTTVTAPVVGITGGYTFPGQTIDEGKDPFKEKYATERGWSMGGGGVDASVSGSVKIIGKGGWYDPSERNK
ncbi:hypothetical protein G8D99_01590 [Acinetobacter lanii]|uniref:RHS protein conserved region domain-containing protein n=1 Tax=Acinetobacter lanii TaxID=2715163 RepID=A0A6G8S0X5_9GAMM|nr:hypothetical protein G8D99_01590 [Acinetobacter lanii]